MIRVALCLSLLLLCSCREPSTDEVSVHRYNFEKICIDGVEYLGHNIGWRSAVMVPHYKKDGSLYTCSEGGE